MSIDGKYAVPTVAVHTDIFYPVTQSVVRMNGMPRMRQAYVPQPIMGKTPQQLRAYIDGPDMKEIEKASKAAADAFLQLYGVNGHRAAKSKIPAGPLPAQKAVGKPRSRKPNAKR